ncbi:Oxo-4-hydroxy-4-carboxy-5-ureidoimidazoline decarboxylase [Ophiocordyceps camponoti-floridani]|uniref:Oxo-4-hydroxy-4-carboxy-5-ureidoimidazoline decarboxylase n=1 Tax=Ophiocordyceps camponoti-floridani TaxID=2030778 RepID=A0A8H4Q910_9HYPO|nr:Oxo-4-hydroxy-4-carboxy-5-ureidoimidazoline decarboxylase [Ophiocordyceps camponoti-floridani]
MELPAIKILSSCPEPEQKAALDLLFEPSAAMHEMLVPIVQSTTHTSYDDLITACQQHLTSLATQEMGPKLLSILGSHPRLGAAKVSSQQSVAEQASLVGGGGGGGDEDEAQTQTLSSLNAEYETRFPGLRYVVFVNGRPRSDIMRDMRLRIDRGDYAREVDAALEAMCDIARDRAAKLPVRASKTS